MTQTPRFILRLESNSIFGPAERARMRTLAGRGLDEGVEGFDLFTGLWWPLRQKNAAAPRRGMAWLIAKLYAFRPIEHSPGQTFAYQLGRCRPARKSAVGAFEKRFDRLLSLPIDKIEPALRWALDLIASKDLKLDWVQLTDDLSLWERDSKRIKWAKEFLKTSKEDFNAD